MPKRKPKKAGGTKRMREFGYKRVEVWLDANEVKICQRAADLVGKKLATFVREAAFGSAGVVLQAESEQLNPNAEMWEKMTGQNKSA